MQPKKITLGPISLSSTLEVLSTGWPNAHSRPRVLLRRMCGGVWPTPPTALHSLWYRFFSVLVNHEIPFHNIFFL